MEESVVAEGMCKRCGERPSISEQLRQAIFDEVSSTPPESVIANEDGEA